MKQQYGLFEITAAGERVRYRPEDPSVFDTFEAAEAAAIRLISLALQYGRCLLVMAGKVEK